MKTRSLYLTLPLFFVCAFPSVAGVMGDFVFLPAVQLTASSALDYALREYDASLFRDSADLHVDILSAAFVDSIAATVNGKPAFILTTAQARAVRQISGVHPDAPREREVLGADDPVESLRTLETAVNTPPPALFPEAVSSLGNLTSSDAPSSLGDSSAEDAGFTTMEIIGYELSKPWLYATALLCTAGLILLIAIRRRTSTPPASL